MGIRPVFLLLVVTMVLARPVVAEDSVSDLGAKGKDLFFKGTSCWVCHGKNAEGLVGPSLRYGPSPRKIQEMLDSVPQMAVVVKQLNPDANDLVALSVYLSGLEGDSATPEQVKAWRAELAAFQAAKKETQVEFELTERDKKVLEIQSFDTVLTDWKQRAKTGSLKRDYEVKVLATYDRGEAVFTPQPGKLYFYENTGTAAGRAPASAARATTTQIVIGDAQAREIIVSAEMPAELRGAVHTTVLSPDARYVYIIGPSGRMMQPAKPVKGNPVLRSPATMLKVDALTLKPVKQLAVGGRLHHGQIFQDRYLLIDTFNSDPDGLDVFLFDPETDRIIGGVRAADLGGRNYTAFTDDEFIYVLMQPPVFAGAPADIHGVASGEMTALRPFWVSKIDPENWEVVAEYPYRGYRGDWIIIDSKSEYFYVPAGGSSNVTKVNMATGAIEWSNPTGIGPYGGTLTADESELWVSNKGEMTGMIGRTITVLDTATGRGKETVFSGYQSDHVLLAPNGKEMWVTSNGEGRIYVFDVKTREQITVIDMPGFGDPHGLVWVYYDESGNGKVVRDQGNFHNGIHPARGKPLELN